MGQTENESSKQQQQQEQQKKRRRKIQKNYNTYFKISLSISLCVSITPEINRKFLVQMGFLWSFTYFFSVREKGSQFW